MGRPCCIRDSVGPEQWAYEASTSKSARKNMRKYDQLCAKTMQRHYPNGFCCGCTGSILYSPKKTLAIPKMRTLNSMSCRLGITWIHCFTELFGYFDQWWFRFAWLLFGDFGKYPRHFWTRFKLTSRAVNQAPYSRAVHIPNWISYTRQQELLGHFQASAMGCYSLTTINFAIIINQTINQTMDLEFLAIKKMRNKDYPYELIINNWP